MTDPKHLMHCSQVPQNYHEICTEGDYMLQFIISNEIIFATSTACAHMPLHPACVHACTTMKVTIIQVLSIHPFEMN
ncbi:hypothetical protein K439DRAFT_1130718 [Ramaria rubella]|nr:hypothetical protein K439DRAFT_1130718 [Ramaria rubella]